MNITQYKLKSNGYFSILAEPYEIELSVRRGLYINVLNHRTGEHCSKKVYKNTKGSHFKHTGYPPSYLDDFTQDFIYIPFQVIKLANEE